MQLMGPDPDRRNVYERKTIRTLRGENVDDLFRVKYTDKIKYDMMKEQISIAFINIRKFSHINAMDIRPMGSYYISIGELNILRWLAEAQRQAGLQTYTISDDKFKAEIVYCADILKKIGTILPSQTLFIHLKND